MSGIDRDCIDWLPRHIACVASCSDLRLDNNQLTGSIPTTLGALSLLASLDLSWNSLNGTVPTALSMLSSITYVSHVARSQFGSPWIVEVSWCTEFLQALGVSEQPTDGLVANSD